MNDLVERGKKAAQEAIKKNDAELLARCIEKLKRIGASVEDIYSAIADCPLGLFEQTGFVLRIYSDVVDRELCLGQQPEWGMVKTLLRFEKNDRETLKALFSEMKVEAVATASEQSTGSLFD